MHSHRKYASIHSLAYIFLCIVILTLFLLYIQKSTLPREPIPGFGLEHFDGTITRLEDYRGRPVIINFWAAWCIACRSEMLIFEKIYKQYEQDGLIVLGVHRSETEDQETATAFAREVSVTYPLIKDERTRIFNYFNQGLTALPTTVFIDRNGYVSARVIGPRTQKEFFELAQDIL